jgi:hypothetical protein
MVTVALCAVVCGADTRVGVAEFGRSKEAWPRTFLALPGGIPSHDTVGRGFAALDPAAVEAAFRGWVQALATATTPPSATASTSSPLFLLGSQDVGYLWNQRSLPPTDGQDASLPTARFPMDPVIEHCFPAFLVSCRLYGSHVESAVMRWLADVADGFETRPMQPEDALERTGFPRLIRGGRVRTEIELLGAPSNGVATCGR